MTSTEIASLRSFAENLAREGGRMAREHRRDFAAFRKLDGSEVTSVDLLIQEHILAALRDAFSDHAVLAEELSPRLAEFPEPGSRRFTWVIDPLDGTRNFVRGLPIHATTIALMDNHVPLVGVVLDHSSDTLFSAARGFQPVCNGQPIHVSDRYLTRQSLVGIASGRNEKTVPVLRQWIDEIVLRNLGSTALHMAYVACGAMDAAFCQECHIWDVAAGWLLITTAGGVCNGLNNQPLFPTDIATIGAANMPFLAGNQNVHAALMGTLTQTRPYST